MCARRATGDEAIAGLSPRQIAVTQRCATEPPFINEFWDNEKPGLYVDIVSGEPLFASVHQDESFTGWPSFTRPVEPHSVVTVPRVSSGVERTEVHSASSGIHLGHLVVDGSDATGGLRYRINSASLWFVMVVELDVGGYGKYRDLFGASSLREVGRR